MFLENSCSLSTIGTNYDYTKYVRTQESVGRIVPWLLNSVLLLKCIHSLFEKPKPKTYIHILSFSKKQNCFHWPMQNFTTTLNCCLMMLMLSVDWVGQQAFTVLLSSVFLTGTQIKCIQSQYSLAGRIFRFSSQIANLFHIYIHIYLTNEIDMYMT